MNIHVRERPPLSSMARTDDLWLAPLMRAEIDPLTPACCCPAPAMYAVVVAPTPRLPNPPEVLLCAHHMHQSRDRLARPDIGVYDVSGHLVELTSTGVRTACRPACRAT